MVDIADQVAAIQTRSDLVLFIQALRDDLRNRPQGWENMTLESFLEAIAAWTSDMDGYYRNVNAGEPIPSWKTFGEMLIAASTYE